MDVGLSTDAGLSGDDGAGCGDEGAGWFDSVRLDVVSVLVERLPGVVSGESIDAIEGADTGTGPSIASGVTICGASRPSSELVAEPSGDAMLSSRLSVMSSRSMEATA